MRTLCFVLAISSLAAWTHAAHAQSDSTQELSLAQSVVSRYCSTWSKVDPAARTIAVADVWAEQGEYLDSQPTRVMGREALAAEIVTVHRQFPGAQFPCHAVRAHQGYAGYTWSLVMADGTERVRGMDFGDIDASGRVVRIVSFFDMPEPAR